LKPWTTTPSTPGSWRSFPNPSGPTSAGTSRGTSGSAGASSGRRPGKRRPDAASPPARTPPIAHGREEADGRERQSAAGRGRPPRGRPGDPEKAHSRHGTSGGFRRSALGRQPVAPGAGPAFRKLRPGRLEPQPRERAPPAAPQDPLDALRPGARQAQDRTGGRHFRRQAAESRSPLTPAL